MNVTETTAKNLGLQIMHACVAALLAICAIDAIRGCYLKIWGQRYPLDYDAFYYLKEFATRMQTGHGYYHSFSVFFLLAENIGRTVNLSPLELYRVAVFGTLLFFALAISMLAFHPKNWWLIPGFFLLVFQSEPLFYLHYGYPRQGFSVSLFALALAFRQYPERAARWASTLFLLLAVLCQVFSAILGVVLIAFYCLRTKGLQRWFVALLGCVIIGGIVWYFIEQPRDFSEALGLSWHLPWQSAADIDWITSREESQYWLYFGLAIAIFVYAWREKTLGSVLGYLSLYVLLVAPIWNIHGGFWYRFLASSSCLTFFALATSVRLFAAGQTSATNAPIENPTDIRLIAAGAFMATLIIPLILPKEFRRVGPDMSVASIADNAAVLRRWMAKDGFIVAPHGIDFRANYLLGLPAASKEPEKQHHDQLYVFAPEVPPDCPALNTFGGDIPDWQPCVRIESHWSIQHIQSIESSPPTGGRHHRTYIKVLHP